MTARVDRHQVRDDGGDGARGAALAVDEDGAAIGERVGNARQRLNNTSLRSWSSASPSRGRWRSGWPYLRQLEVAADDGAHVR